MAEPEAGAEERSESHVLAERREKLERLRGEGVEPYPHQFEGRTEIATVRAEHEGLEPGEETESSYRVAGRIAARRGHGKSAFIDLVDGTGRIQLHSRADVVGERSHELLTGLDLGDFVGVDGDRLQDPARRALAEGDRLGRCWPRACARRPTSSTASRTPSCATATASST